MASRLQQELKQSRPFPNLHQEAVLAIARTASVLNHAWEQRLRPYGITATQYNVLRILRGARPSGLCRHEISARLVTAVPDVSRLLDRMAAAGLASRTRDAADRRLVKAMITEKGLRVLAELDEPSTRYADQHFAHIPDDRIQELLALLEAARIPPGA